jgi:hypothetical protein
MFLATICSRSWWNGGLRAKGNDANALNTKSTHKTLPTVHRGKKCALEGRFGALGKWLKIGRLWRMTAVHIMCFPHRPPLKLALTPARRLRCPPQWLKYYNFGVDSKATGGTIYLFSMIRTAKAKGEEGFIIYQTVGPRPVGTVVPVQISVVF